MLGVGLATNLAILVHWLREGFAGPLEAVRLAIFALTAMVVGAQVLFSSFYLDLLRVTWDQARPTIHADSVADGDRSVD